MLFLACGICNRFKCRMSLDEFSNWVDRIYDKFQREVESGNVKKHGE